MSAQQTAKLCDRCHGSGVTRGQGGFPALDDQVWCPSCEAGCAKAERVAALVTRSLSRRALKVA